MKYLRPLVNKFDSIEKFISEVDRQLLKLIDENPSFVYNPNKSKYCEYTIGCYKGPECDGCIFGQAFQRMGMKKDESQIQRAQDTGANWRGNS